MSSPATDTSSTHTCGSCGVANQSTDQFCSGCGHSLWDKCPNCSQQTLIGRNFCNKCGHDLKSATNQKIEELQSQIERARVLIDEGKFQFAIRILETISGSKDFRFKAEVEQAEELLQATTEQHKEWETRLEKIPQKASRYLQEFRYDDAVSLLDAIPKGLLTEELSDILAEAKNKSEAGVRAKTNLKGALADKDWKGAIYELATLQTLFPHKEKYPTLTKQVVEKITKVATKLVSQGAHSEALEQLSALPAEHQDEKVESLRRNLEELTYLRRLVAASPFCSPVIGAAIERIQKLTPSDPKLPALQKRYEESRKNRAQKSYHLHPKWMRVVGGTHHNSISPSVLPNSIPGARPPALAQAGAQYWTAFGLALQGLGLGQETGNLLRQSKSGLFGLLGRKKAASHEAAWGMDIGDYSIKLLRLKQDEKGVQIDQARSIPFGEFKSSESAPPKSTAIFRALEKTLSDSQLGETPVVCNMANSDLLTRYLDLPVDNPGQHEQFVSQEAQANIPISLDLLSSAYYTFDKARESAVSQLAMLLALRKADVEARASMMKKLNVNLVGLTPEPIANYNTLKHLEMLNEFAEGTTNALLLIDVGHFHTSIQLIAYSGSWYRTIDWGIDSLNHALATGLKLTHADADALRRNIMRSRSIAETMNILREACTVPKREIERSIRAATEHLVGIQVEKAILIGGGAYQPFLGSLLNNENL